MKHIAYRKGTVSTPVNAQFLPILFLEGAEGVPLPDDRLSNEDTLGREAHEPVGEACLDPHREVCRLPAPGLFVKLGQLL